MPLASSLRAAACACLLVAASVATAQTTLESRVASSRDDAEQFADSTMYLGSSDLELIHDSNDQIVGMRWAGLAIPPGVTITAAWIQFTAKAAQSAAASLVFRGQAADAAPAFTSARYDIGARPRTSASVTWAPPAWTSGAAAAAQRTPDLKSVVQQVVSRPGWASGNPLVIIVNGSGVRTAWAWDGNAASAPLLHIEYSGGTPPVDQPPVANLAVTQLASPPLTVSASALGSTDTDATPIASYSFDFGDGTQPVVVNAPIMTTTHTYASAGTYTVTLIATDTGALASTPRTSSITVNPPQPDLPPVASLAVTQLASPALTVSASGAGSTDADVTPIASYSFDWGDGSSPTVVSAPTLTATHTYAAAGPYTVTLIATDTGSQASAPKTADIAVTASVTVTTVEARVAASSDDAEQALTGSMSLTSSDLELIKDSADQIVGMRWTGLAIPTGATIRAAWIQFMSKASQSVVTNLVLRAQAADNAATFTSSSNNISSRPLTTASAAWAPVAWTSGLAGANQRTPDLSAVVQEVVNRGGWAFGNALAIVVSGTGQRTAWAWNGSATSAALLHIEYSGGSPPVDNPPVASLAVTRAPSPPLTVSASAAGSTDTDPTPIASYSFDWGDGSAATVVNAPAQIATHTYASAGTYTVTLIATDTGALASTPKTASITVNPPAPDLPPVASLAVTQMASPALTVSASGAGSTDTDATPIASYSFDWGDGTTATVVNAPAQAATHTYASAGPYTVTLVVTDTGAQASAPTTAGITVTASVTVTTVEARVAASTDDAEQSLTGSMSLTSSDLELIHDGTDQVVGMRWAGLAIPTGATIRAAWIQFMSKEAQSEVTNLVLRAQAADNAATFTSTSNNISSRPLTTASAAWTPVAWTSGLVGPDQRTPDLSAVVQEVVNRGGWAFGNALAIVVTGTGHRTAWAWNGSATSAALLHIEYSGGSPPVDRAPVASLAVTQAPSPPLTVSASAAGSTDTDPTPIASYTFDWGDGSSGTVVNAPAQVASHTYASTGTYTVTLTAKDTGGLISAPVTASFTVNATPAAKVAVYVGYYDTHHHATTLPKPSPWEGSPGVVFVGKADDSAYNWDSSALRVDNLTGADMTVLVSCDVGSKRFDLWGSRTIPANGKLILAQTAFQNFDGSDTSPAGCYGCDPSLCLTKVVNTIPIIHVTVAGVLTNYYDNTQVLNTKGADGAGCPYTGGRNDESQQWKQIGTTAAVMEGSADENGEFVPERMTFDAPAPNPVRDWTVLRFMLPKASRVAVDILDVAGRRMRTSLDRDMPAGIFQQGVTLQGLDPGVYYVQVRTAYGRVQRPVVVSR